MRVSMSLVLSFLFNSSSVLSFGIRGSAERAVYYASYVTEDVFTSSERKLAVGCVGSRTTLLGAKNRCNLLEFVDYIWQQSPTNAADTKLNMQDVMMGDKFYADAKASGDWGSLGQLDAKTPSERVKWMTKAVDQVKIRVPWMRNGAQVVYPDGNLKWRTQVPSGNKYSGNFDTVKLEGINRGTTPADFAEFVREFGQYQKRAKERLDQATVSPELRDKFLSWHTTISDAVDNVIELRMMEMNKVMLAELRRTYVPTHGALVLEPYPGKFQNFDVLEESLTHGNDPTKKAALEAAILAMHTADGGNHQASVDGWTENKGTLSC